MKKILILDDEEGIRESLKLILEDFYDLILTSNNDQALQCLKNNKDIGLVLLDIKMPKVSGLDTLKVIKEQYPHIKVVMITGYKSVEIACESTYRGACDYIIKPFKSEDILAMAKKQMGG